jgi:hypothetical protein
MRMMMVRRRRMTTMMMIVIKLRDSRRGAGLCPTRAAVGVGVMCSNSRSSFGVFSCDWDGTMRVGFCFLSPYLHGPDGAAEAATGPLHERALVQKHAAGLQHLMPHHTHAHTREGSLGSLVALAGMNLSYGADKPAATQSSPIR